MDNNFLFKVQRSTYAPLKESSIVKLFPFSFFSVVDAARGPAVHFKDTLWGELPRPVPARALREQAQHGLRGSEER